MKRWTGRRLVYIRVPACQALCQAHPNTAITTTLRSGRWHTHVTKEETEAHASEMTCPRSHWVLEPAFKPRSVRLHKTEFGLWSLRVRSWLSPKWELNPLWEPNPPATARITEPRSLPASPGGSQAYVAVAMTTSFLIIIEHDGDTKSHTVTLLGPVFLWQFQELKHHKFFFNPV